MHERRWAVLLAIVAGCEAPAAQAPAPTAWVYPPPEVAAWPLGTATGAIGRGQPPQLATRAGLTGDAKGRLQLPTPWQVPGRDAVAIIYGTLGTGPDVEHVIEAVDIDTGKLAWRDETSCPGPVVGVTNDYVVCTDGQRVRVVGLAGKPAWKLDGVGFVTMHDDHLVVTDGHDVRVLDVASGDELARVRLPAGVAPDSIIASCGDAGRELFAYGEDGRLVRIAEGHGGPQIKWAVPLERVSDIDACWNDSVLVTLTTSGGTSLLTLARDSGKQLGRIDGVLGHWTARVGTTDIEVSTAAGIARWSRELTGAGVPLERLPLGELLAAHGSLRLVRATPATAVLLDRAGVRAYLHVPYMGAAIGERALVASSWTGEPGETVHRLLYPGRYARALRVTPPARHVNVPAELRDLPPAADIDVATARVGDKVDPSLARDLANRGWLPDAPREAPSTAALLDIDGMAVRVAYERGRVIGTLPRVQDVPAWSLEVNGVVAQIVAAGDGVVVVLEDGDGYRVDGRSGRATAIAGISDRWYALGDLIASGGDGGPVPPPDWPPAAVGSDAAPNQASRKAKRARKPPAKARAKDAAKNANDDAVPRPPRLMTPVPPPANMRPSYQLTLFELTGELRARNDYALAAPVTPGRRAPGAPLVIESGPGDGGVREALVVDAERGDPLRRVRLPEDAIPGASFSTVLDGKSIVGTLLANPVRVVLF